MNTLEDFLRAHATSNKDNITHTRIGGKVGDSFIHPGKYEIPEQSMPLFYKLYNQKVFVNNKKEYLTEKQLFGGRSPLLVDLDFRYPPEVKKRKHSDDHIIDVIEMYIHELNSIYQFDEETTISVYVLHKPNVNCIESPKPITKDGVHIIFGITVDHDTQCYIREKLLENIGNALDDLKLSNKYEDVLDKCISEGKTNWQMYGSCKPSNEQYQLTNIYDFDYDMSEREFNYIEKDIEDYKSLELLTLLSARNPNNKKYEFIESFVETHENYRENRKKKKSTKSTKTTSLKSMKGYYSLDISKIKSVEDIKEEVEEYLQTTGKNSIENEVYKYVMCLSSDYYDNFQLWLNVGWALHNTNNALFMVWMEFSAQSDKFDISDIEKYYDDWDKMDDHGFTERSIMYWAKKSNPSEYKKIRSETIDYYMESSAKGTPTDYDIGMVVYQLFKDEYRCVIHQNDKVTWYHFTGHMWNECKGGSSMRLKLSREVSKLYGDKSDELTDFLDLLVDSDEYTDNQKEMIRKRSAKYNQISINLRNKSPKANIMREIADIFNDADSDFYESLNQNPDLLCFTNGVYDFSKKEFRDGQPDDYISICTNIPYKEYNPKNVSDITIKEEIDDFFSKLFPDSSLCEYMWQHLSTCMSGHNKNQTMHIYNGCGRNGKSKLAELMMKVLGDYACSITAALITQKRTAVGTATPELANLVHARYVLMSEPSKGDKVNDGYLKELTGGDPITARPMYKDPVTFVPQFKLVLCTNTLLDIKSNDDGTWRRMRLCEFESKFVDEPAPCEASPYEFLVDKEIGLKFERWKSIMASLLVSVYNKIDGKVIDCPRVIEASNRYRNDQDYLSLFYNEYIEKGDSTSVVMKSVIYNEFKNWYLNNFDKNVPKGRELHAYLEKKMGAYKNGWKGYRIIYNDGGEEGEEELDCDI